MNKKKCIDEKWRERIFEFQEKQDVRIHKVGNEELMGVKDGIKIPRRVP